MSTDYKYTIRRKADNKIIAAFYYNRIKSLCDVISLDFKLKLDPQNIKCDEYNQVRYDVLDMQNDVEKLKLHIKTINMQILEKKILIPTASSIEIKREMEEDILHLESEISDCFFAIEAILGLKTVVEVLVEDNIKIDAADDEESVAYCFNAKGLPISSGNNSPYIWANDVFVEAVALI